MLCLAALALGEQRKLRLYAPLGMACGAALYALGSRRVLGAVIRRLKGGKKPSRQDP